MWGKLLGMRRDGFFIKDLIKMAHAEGHPELTYEIIRLGFTRVSSAFGLPTRTAGWLQRKHKATAGMIDAMETMTFTLMEAMEDWQAVKEERAKIGHSEAYRTTMANREQKLRDTVFSYAERIRKLQVELEKLRAEAGADGGGLGLNAPGFVVTDVDTMQKAIGGLMERWNSVVSNRLGSSDVDEAAIQQFGSQNIRPAIPEDDAPTKTIEGEEDFTEGDE